MALPPPASDEELDSLLVAYPHTLAQIRTILQTTAHHQGISLPHLLAAVRALPYPSHSLPANNEAIWSGHYQAYDIPSDAWSSHDAINLTDSYSSHTYQPFLQPEVVGAGLNVVPDVVPQRDVIGGHVWPTSFASSPHQPTQPSQFDGAHQYTENGIKSSLQQPHQHMTSTADRLDQPCEQPYQGDTTNQQRTPNSYSATYNSPSSATISTPATPSSSSTAVGRAPKRKRNQSGGPINCQSPGSCRPAKRIEEEKQQQQRTRTRRIGACVRCRMQHLHCNPNPDDPNGPCLTCRSVTGPTLYTLPCLRYKISNALLHDHVSCPRPTWTIRWSKMELKDISLWNSSEVKVISITQDIGGLSIELRVREFVPQKGDSLARRWVVRGQHHAYNCTPYAIENMRQTGEQYKAFVRKHLGAFICHYTDETDPLIRNTYMMAWRYSRLAPRKEESRLLRNVLHLWMGLRMETRSDRICSDETLGMEPYYGSNCENAGHILLPPVLTAQAEIIVTTMILQPAAKAVLQDLHDLIYANKPHSWFAIYLAMFILMHSCSLLTSADNRKAQKQGLAQGPYRRALIEELHLGARILLAHFHYCSRGSSPFTQNGLPSRSSSAHGHFDDEQLQFIRETRQQVKEKASLFQRVRATQDYEHEVYFLSQLYDNDWKPDHVGL